MEREKYVDDSSFTGNSNPSNPLEQIVVVFPVCTKSETLTVDHINRESFGRKKKKNFPITIARPIDFAFLLLWLQ